MQNDDKKPEPEEQPDERFFHGLSLPFEPTRLREFADQAQGINCNCKSCFATWIIAIAEDFLDDSELGRSAQFVAMSTALASVALLTLASGEDQEEVKKAILELVKKEFETMQRALDRENARMN